MNPFRKLRGTAIPLGLKNVDTDLIISSEHLKVTTRQGLGKFAFAKLRAAHADNVFDSPRAVGASILIAGENFGCGSSREHAAWAIADMGIRAIIAPSFADIFSSNAFKNGILLVELSQERVDLLLDLAKETPITIDLESQTVVCGQTEARFAYDAFRKTCLLEGLDEIGVTEREKALVEGFVAKHAQAQPWSVKASRKNRTSVRGEV